MRAGGRIWDPMENAWAGVMSPEREEGPRRVERRFVLVFDQNLGTVMGTV